MRIAVMGTGAVGGFFGAKLALASHDLAFIARGAHLEMMRREGLMVKSIDGDVRVREALFTPDPAAVGPVELILFCVKSYDTDESAKRLTPMVGNRTAILSLQNGVGNADEIARVWGKNRTLAGVVYLGARIPSAGVVEHTAAGKIVFGALDGDTGAMTETVERAFSSAQIPCLMSAEIRQVMWKKLLWNAPFCALACLARATVRDILDSDSLRKLAVDCMEEVRAAAKTQGIDLPPEAIEETLSFSVALGDYKPSMLQDLEAGKPLEHEAFNGIVVNVLRQAGREAPTNQIFYGALKHLDKKQRTTAQN